MATIFSEDILIDKNSEKYEFNIGKTQNLICQITKDLNSCGHCESCQLAHSVTATRNWFWRCSDAEKKRFLKGLVQRCHSADLLRNIIDLLKPLLSKDFTYARNRIAPSLSTDQNFDSSNRALDMNDIETSIKYTWTWFDAANYWTKSNFMLGLMKFCDIQLLFTIGNHSKTLLKSEAKSQKFHEEDHLMRVKSAISAGKHQDTNIMTAVDFITSSRATSPTRQSGKKVDSRAGTTTPGVSQCGLIFDDSGSEEDDDPTLYIIPSSEKALVGVCRYKDFIKELPVHLSKCVLGYFDEATLHNCGRVSKYWAGLVKEMRAEFYANQQMWEDIMLMQGSSGVNPQYANDIDVLVPNITTDTQQAIRLSGETSTEPKVLKDERFKSEMNFENAYSGYSSRKVIMEERNLYCGSYNVLVLVTEPDNHRVIHTCGGRYLPFNKGRRCHLIDISTGRETDNPIAGHSGRIHSISIQEDEGFLLTGSFDTSIRKWDLETMKCIKIYNGHQDTIVAIDYCKKTKQFASACLDRSCKVWNIDSKKCWRTFKHKGKVIACFLGKVQCITGCTRGRIKVWALQSGQLIKMLMGHDGPITAIKFDRWHIVTASQDGYALAWSNQGNHKRCLTALRHPSPVLCMEFMYLRVITGCEDGRVRIWNMINGQCCRIMRGNSQSDAVLSIHTIGDRMTINTKSNVLQLTFEHMEWDYSNDSDKVVTFVIDDKYKQAPLKTHSYPYIRAQRSARAASADVRLIKQNAKPPFSRKTSGRSVKSGTQSLREASGVGFDDRPQESIEPAKPKHLTLKEEPEYFQKEIARRDLSMKKSASARGLDGVGINEDALSRRRVSWAFEHPPVAATDDPSLSDIKAMLKKQIRGTTQTPDFVYLTISALKNQVLTTHQKEFSNNLEFFKGTGPPIKPATKPILTSRPKSSPSSIDSKTKVSIDSEMEELLNEFSAVADDFKSTSQSTHSRRSNRSAPAVVISARQRAEAAQAMRVNSAGFPRSKSAEMWRHKTAKKLSRDQNYHRMTTTATETNLVPMLMYPKDKRPAVNTTHLKKWPSQETVAKNHPLCSKDSMKLLTFTQESQISGNMKSVK